MNMRKLLFYFLTLFIAFNAFSQNKTDKIKLFLDCNTRCDFDYLKREINLVDFTPDNKIADVHVLITEQGNGGGGSQYQLIFFGQNQFKNLQDTLRFATDANATQFIKRDLLSKYIQLGLAPYVAKTTYAQYATINFKQSEESKKSDTTVKTKDKWNYWVFNIGANGNLNGEKVYKGASYSGNVSANRITDKIKVSFELRGRKNKTTYTIEDPTGIDPPTIFINNNHNFSFTHRLVKSINQHWSYGYDLNLVNSTFSNYKLQSIINPAIEYNIFPYSESNNKLLTIRYGIDVRHNKYIDSTLYFKTKETLIGQGLNVALSFTQKWGSSSVGIDYHNYFFNNWKYYSLGLNGSVNVRISGGLSFNAGVFAGLTRDQISLSGKNSTQQDILIRRRQLASSYNYFTFFGINYRFGSKLNNFVNPSFEGGNGGFFFFN